MGWATWAFHAYEMFQKPKGLTDHKNSPNQPMHMHNIREAFQWLSILILFLCDLIWINCQARVQIPNGKPTKSLKEEKKKGFGLRADTIIP